jgi:hypothetical protein
MRERQDKIVDKQPTPPRKRHIPRKKDEGVRRGREKIDSIQLN